MFYVRTPEASYFLVSIIINKYYNLLVNINTLKFLFKIPFFKFICNGLRLT